MNFTNTTNPKGTSMNREQKANPTSTPTTGLAAKLSNLFRVQGTSAPALTPAPKGPVRPHTKLLALLAISLVALCATAASAAAAPLATTTPELSDVSYASVKVTGKVTTPDCQGICGFAYSFQYSKDPLGEGWTPGPRGIVGKEVENKEVPGEITGLTGGTEYFVRLVAENGFFIADPANPEATSPLPNPSFTTLTADPPVVEQTDNAAAVKYTTASVSGKVNRPVKSNDLTCNFEYITDKAFNDNPSGEEFLGAAQAPCETDPPSAPGVITAPGPNPVSAKLTGLTNATTYHLRIVVSNASAEDAQEAPSTFTTLTVDPPTVKSIENAGEVEYTQAKVKGVVERPATSPDPAFDITCNFEYVTDQQFNENPSGEEFLGATPVACEPVAKPDENPITATGPRPVEATLAGLLPSTTYHLRLSATNQGGSDAKAAPATFTTAGPVPKPTVTVNDASEVKFNTATLTGKVLRPDGADPALDVNNCRFEYITDAQFQDNITIIGPDAGFEGATPAYCEQNPITSPGETTVSAKAETVATTKYHFRLVAENEGGTDTVVAATFTTPEAELPTVTIDPVEGGTFTTAHVSGTVDFDPGYEFARLYPQISTDNKNWSSEGLIEFPESGVVYPPSVENGGIVSFARDFANLQPSTTYFFRICAAYTSLPYDQLVANGELACSPEPNPEIPTEAPQAPPIAENLAVTDVTATSAHFSGTVNPNAPAGPLSGPAKKAYATKWHFECVPECLDANEHVIGGTVQGEEGPQPVAGDVKRLDANTEYEVSLIVSSEGGSDTEEETFPTKKIPPTVKAFPGGSDGKGGYVLQGSVNPNGSPVSDCTFAWGPEAHEELNEYAFQADCSPTPSPRNEVQSIKLDAIGFGQVHVPLSGGQFQLTYRGQTTNDLPYNATAAEVEAALEAFPTIGPGNVGVTNEAQSYEVTFEGALAGTNPPQIQGKQGTIPLTTDPISATASITVSTLTQGGNSAPITVEAALTGLTPDANYNFRLFATNAAGTEKTENLIFKPTLAKAEPCPANEQQRIESNSLALPECRAYELVTPMGKEGFGATLKLATATGSYDGSDRVAYNSKAGNLAKSGQGNGGTNRYVAQRTDSGWQTIPNLNGSSGSFHDAPTNAEGFPITIAYSQDLLSSVWQMTRQGELGAQLRSPDGTFALIGLEGSETIPLSTAASADLSHLLVWSWRGEQSIWGPGVYEFLGTGMAQPRRVDLDNSGTPISTCLGTGQGARANAVFLSLSSDASTIVNKVFGGCGGANPPADELWARVNGTTSIDVSASHCTRLDCNAPANATFQGAARDGSRVFFTTTQQLVDTDTDQSNDIYACDLPAGNPAPTSDKANPCSAFRQISVAEVGAAEVESVFTQPPGTGTGIIATSSYPGVSDDGSTALFTAKGVLADNKDALGEKALAGDHNLYLWRATDDNPDGQTAFLARLEKNDLDGSGVTGGGPQVTPDGRYLLFTTANQLLDTDTDSARDVYRYDVDAEDLTRVSTNVFGVAGNGDFDAQISGPVEHNPTTAISDDGQKIVFTTAEALAPSDGNGEPDVYLWTPDRVSLISTGSSGFAPRNPNSGSAVNPAAFIDPSGEDIYFESAQQLTPADGDSSTDVYDARVGGGFSFAQAAPCSGAGGACQSHAPASAPSPAPATAQPPADPGNVKPKTCPKGKVLKGKKCVKKNKHKKHSGKKHSGKKAGHNRGGSK